MCVYIYTYDNMFQMTSPEYDSKDVPTAALDHPSNNCYFITNPGDSVSDANPISKVIFIIKQ